MELLIIATYSSLCYLVFKVFKIAVTKWSVTTAVLIGVLFLFLTVITMNYNHPYTSNARVYFVSTPIIPNVASEVTKVYIDGLEQEVEKGDTLFTMDSTIFVSRIRSLNASLNLARTRLQESTILAERRSGSIYDVEQWQSEVDRLQADLIEARYNLKECVVTAPSKGKIVQNRLRPGMRGVTFPLRPLMTFVDTEKKFIVGAFPQNPIQRLEIGNEAEVAFDAIPGRIFKGNLVQIGDAIAQGELQAYGTLYNFDLNHHQGSIPMLITLTDDTEEYFIPGGAKAQMAIYSHYMHPVMIIRKMLLRMKGWLNYIFGEH
jgi:multidrug resistance efflux pump